MQMAKQDILDIVILVIGLDKNINYHYYLDWIHHLGWSFI